MHESIEKAVNAGSRGMKVTVKTKIKVKPGKDLKKREKSGRSLTRGR